VRWHAVVVAARLLLLVVGVRPILCGPVRTDGIWMRVEEAPLGWPNRLGEGVMELLWRSAIVAAAVRLMLVVVVVVVRLLLLLLLVIVVAAAHSLLALSY
jgi:hypothetical protein